MKTGCKRCRLELAGVPAGTPPAAAVRKHLEECADCRSWLEEDAVVWKLLGEDPEPSVPRNLVDSICSAAQKPRRSPAVPFRLALAGAALLGALLGVWLGSAFIVQKEPVRAPEEHYLEVFDTAFAVGLEPSQDSAGRLP